MNRKMYLAGICFTCSLALQSAAQNNPSATVGDTGTVTFTYRGSPVTYVTVRAADGKVWMQQNMGADHRAAAATDAGAYGHLFQWGRWDDGHQLRNSATAPVASLGANNPSGLGGGSASFYLGSNPADWWGGGSPNDSWTGTTASSFNGIDPCTAAGPNWHLPNEFEWANVLTLESITNVASGFSSHLMLPAAGMRDGGNGNLVNTGTYGAYWTNNTSMSYAKSVAILTASVNASDDALRGYGFSLRCMLSCPPSLPPAQLLGEDTVCAESTQQYHVLPVPGAIHSWTVPAGWTIIGPDNRDTVTIKIGSTPGNILVKTKNACDELSAARAFPILVRPLPVPVITATGSTLQTGTFSAYQWLLNGSVIPGATGASHTVAANGAYRVKVTDGNGCSDTSAVYNFNGTGIDEQQAGITSLTLYPNPAGDQLHIRMQTGQTSLQSISLTDITGRTLLFSEMSTTAPATQYTLNTSGLSTGTYLLLLRTGKGQVVRQVTIRK